MDKINEFINHKLPEDFLFPDDFVMEKLQRCIDKLIRFKQNIALDLIPPAGELPTLPFGDLNKLSKQELISQIQRYHAEKKPDARDAQLQEIANDRLQVEKRARAERRKQRAEERRKRQQLLLNGGDTPSNLETYLNGKPIRNISDSDDSDEEENNGLADDSSDDEVEYNSDDLNPSKISEYDKESMLSNMTRESAATPHRQRRSYNDVSVTRRPKKPSSGSPSAAAAAAAAANTGQVQHGLSADGQGQRQGGQSRDSGGNRCSSHVHTDLKVLLYTDHRVHNVQPAGIATTGQRHPRGYDPNQPELLWLALLLFSAAAAAATSHCALQRLDESGGQQAPLGVCAHTARHLHKNQCVAHSASVVQQQQQQCN